MTQTIKTIAQNRPVILIGYSGGALLSGLIINQNPDINVKQWITIAGVLNHSDWTKYFGDKPLTQSQDMITLPQIPQIHYVAEKDTVVPYELSQKWTNNKKLITVPNATHSNFTNIKINFNNY
jgi:pimeloyl-ACP methyl ester carboxylesterase